MKQSFRWFGPNDPVKLNYIKQAGAINVVSALHHISNGDVWTVEEIKKRKILIEEEGLKWSVVESLPIHEDIKKVSGSYLFYINNYIKSLINLASCGIKTVCYNFMPVLDWTRTSIEKKLDDGSKTMVFNKDALNAFDLFIVNRKKSKESLSKKEIDDAKSYYKHLDSSQVEILTKSIIAGLPGSEESYEPSAFIKSVNEYSNITSDILRSNLVKFLSKIIPVCDKYEIKLCIHPDDPPFSIFGLPRIVSTYDDLLFILNSFSSKNNGLTFCTGSFGSRSDNDLIKIFKNFSNKVHFIHLRNIKKDNKGNFYESSLLDGDIDMISIIKIILNEEKNRFKKGIIDNEIDMRPDHGLQILDDIYKKNNPGYSAIGRLKSLAEIRGLSIALSI
jgi:mannonate dehydratase